MRVSASGRTVNDVQFHRVKPSGVPVDPTVHDRVPQPFGSGVWVGPFPAKREGDCYFCGLFMLCREPIAFNTTLRVIACVPCIEDHGIRMRPKKQGDET